MLKVPGAPWGCTWPALTALLTAAHTPLQIAEASLVAAYCRCWKTEGHWSPRDRWLFFGSKEGMKALKYSLVHWITISNSKWNCRWSMPLKSPAHFYLSKEFEAFLQTSYLASFTTSWALHFPPRGFYTLKLYNLNHVWNLPQKFPLIFLTSLSLQPMESSKRKERL